MAIAIVAEKFGQKPSERLGILDEVIAYDFDKAAALCLRDSELEMWKVEQELENKRTKAITETIASIFGGAGGSSDPANSEPTINGQPISQLSDEEIERLTRPKEMGHARRVNGQILDGIGERYVKRVAEERARKVLNLGRKTYDQMTKHEQMKFSALLSRYEGEEIETYLATPPNERKDVTSGFRAVMHDVDATRRYEEARKQPGHTYRDESGKELFTTQPSPRVLRRLEYNDPDVV